MLSSYMEDTEFVEFNNMLKVMTIKYRSINNDAHIMYSIKEIVKEYSKNKFVEYMELDYNCEERLIVINLKHMHRTHSCELTFRY